MIQTRRKLKNVEKLSEEQTAKLNSFIESIRNSEDNFVTKEAALVEKLKRLGSETGLEQHSTEGLVFNQATVKLSNNIAKVHHTQNGTLVHDSTAFTVINDLSDICAGCITPALKAEGDSQYLVTVVLEDLKFLSQNLPFSQLLEHYRLTKNYESVMGLFKSISDGLETALSQNLSAKSQVCLLIKTGSGPGIIKKLLKLFWTLLSNLKNSGHNKRELLSSLADKIGPKTEQQKEKAEKETKPEEDDQGNDIANLFEQEEDSNQEV